MLRACRLLLVGGIVPFLMAADSASLPLHSSPTTSAPVDPSPAAAGDIINSVSNLGSSPLGITVTPDDTIYVVDLFAGNTYLYDLELNNLGSIPNPGGTSTHSGLVFNPQSGLLHFVAYGNDMMYATDLNGVLQMAIPLVSPAGGNIGGIDYDASTNTFWAVDIVNDVYFETELDGTLTGNSFPSPVGSSTFGNGITKIDGTNLLDVPAGVNFVDTMFRVDATTNTVVDQISLAGVPDTFINGVQYHATGSTGAEAVYLVGNATNVIFEIEALPTAAPLPEFTRGDANGDGQFLALTDVVFLLTFGFAQGAEPPCLATADADGNLVLQVLTDAVYMLNAAFVSGSPPIPPPFPDCGTHEETTNTLGCLAPPCP